MDGRADGPVTGLVLSRKCGEVICVGDDVQVRVVSLCRDHVRLQVFAPRSVSVDRLEVRAAKLRGTTPRGDAPPGDEAPPGGG